MSGSWLNLVEVWFGIVERQAIRGGTFVSVRELIGKICEFISSWNNRKHPFIWAKTPEEILAKIDRKRKLTSPPPPWQEPSSSKTAKPSSKPSTTKTG